MMSLLSATREQFIILESSEEPDGRGGQCAVWTEGEAISGSLAYNTSTRSTEGGADKVQSTYTLFTTRDIELDFHTVLRRVADGKVLRVISDSDDRFTPQGAGLDIRQVDCEEWIIPEDE